MPPLLPIKWFLLQSFSFLVTVTIEAWFLHSKLDFSKRASVAYSLMVNSFSFMAAWAFFMISFYTLGSDDQKLFLGAMLLGTIGEILLKNTLSPLNLMGIIFYFVGIFYLEFKTIEFIKTVLLTTPESFQSMLAQQKKLGLFRAILKMVLTDKFSQVLAIFYANIFSNLATVFILLITQI